MKEKFLHFLWNLKAIHQNQLKTYHGSLIEIINFGQLNLNAGPDFYNSEILIGKQLWVGCVEMHVNSSDWDVHQHSSDKAYQNVILHVVWNHDKEIDSLRQRNVETLILKDYVSKEIVFNYHQMLQQSYGTISCSGLISKVDWEKINFFFNRITIERLENKAQNVLNIYEKSNHHWEEVTFKLIASNFGLTINRSAFETWSYSFPFEVLQKIQHNAKQIEALFLGQAGFLQNPSDDYAIDLRNGYDFLKHKYNLISVDKSIFKFSSLRPHGYPTIRLAQLAAIYSQEKNLFSVICNFQSVKEMEEYFKYFKPTKYWENHYLMGKSSKISSKKLSKSKIHNLIINVILPLHFAYTKTIDRIDVDYLVRLLEQLPSESNALVDLFLKLNFPILNAKDSQAILHLKKDYCDEKKCLNCAIGNEVLKP